jgi:protein-disulfide isomerase
MLNGRFFLSWVLVGLCGAIQARAQTGDKSTWQPLSGTDTVVAVVHGEAITMADLEEYSRTAEPKGLFQLNQQLFDFREQMLDGLVAERLLAREAEQQGLSVEQLLSGQVQAGEVTEAEIIETFERSRQQPAASGQPPVDLDVARPMIRSYLEGRRRSEARGRYVRQLKERAQRDGGGVSITLPIPRQSIPVSSSDPVEGKGLEIVEFADFECSYCKQLEPVMKSLLTRFEGRVKLVWKDYPLPDHQFAQAAAEAARCADDQGRFRPYRDLLFANQTALAPGDLDRYADRIGLNMPQFAGCVKAALHRDAIGFEARRAVSHGVAATPTVFINGRMIAGVKPFETYERIVLQELGASR